MASSLFLPRFGAIVVLTLSLSVSHAVAQSYEEQAKAILELFQQGRRDTAYELLEPLKKQARYVPAVLYARAEMTPDDRALALYREIVALDPDGPYADDALYRLVGRYAEKRDSIAATTWQAVLRSRHTGSVYVARADSIVASVAEWSISATGDAANAGATASDSDIGTSSQSADTQSAPPRYSGSGMRGFAIQVGLFPTRSAANAHAATLRKKNLRPVTLPKRVGGERRYALVVGPYATMEEASKHRKEIANICDCGAFVVEVR